MENKQIKWLIFLFLPLLLVSYPAIAQNTLKTTVPKKTDGTRSLSWGEINILADPIFILGGAGIALEYRPVRWISLYLNHQRRIRKGNSISVDLGESTQHTETSQYASMRFYLLDFNRWTPFISAGHKWGLAEVEYYPGMFNGAGADKFDYQTGAYVGAGYRMTGSMGKTMNWILDLNINYEPGMVRSVTYIEEKPGLFGPEEASIEVAYKYGVSPEARFGISF